MLLFNQAACFRSFRRSYFNTSNVTIQRKRQRSRKPPYLNFNTSNVTIQQCQIAITENSSMNFNTSNVTIQLKSSVPVVFNR